MNRHLAHTELCVRKMCTPEWRQKNTALDLQGLRCGGDSWTRTRSRCAIACSVRFAIVALLRCRLHGSLLTTFSPRFIAHWARFGSAPNRCVSHINWTLAQIRYKQQKRIPPARGGIFSVVCTGLEPVFRILNGRDSTLWSSLPFG